MAKNPSPPTRATAKLAAAGIEFTVHAYRHDAAVSAYGLEAAASLSVDPARIFKTLLVDVDGEACVCVVPVIGQASLKAVAVAFQAKRAQLMEVGRAEKETGYVVGGISPIAQKRTHRTVLDESALGWDQILVSAGQRGLEVQMRPGDLVDLTGAVVSRITEEERGAQIRSLQSTRITPPGQSP